MCDGRVLCGYPLEFSDICFIYPPTYDDIVRKGYDKYIELVKDPAEYKIAKDRLEKLEAAEMESSVGLIDKIMGFFNKA